MDHNPDLFHDMKFGSADLRFLANSNTFRKGDKYASLVPGEFVQPVDDEGKPIGQAVTIRGVHVMHLGDALSTYAARNHGIREENAKRVAMVQEGHTDHQVAGPDYLRALLNKAYVASDFTDDEMIVTVIEFGKALPAKLILDEKALA